MRKPPRCLAASTAGTVLAGAACWAEITMETWLGEGHWQWLRAGGGGGNRDLCRGSQPAPGPFGGTGKAGAWYSPLAEWFGAAGPESPPHLSPQRTIPVTPTEVP